ncbi:MAG: hypothetical protein HY731_06890, partial [Candidatus Tectomicrobia bacterium]|nr:hypothetical protein [Candidatus Tectomicrobia bacterium]
ISIGPFDEEDWQELLTPFSGKGITIDSSAQKELRNWTGGVPVLVAAMASRLFEQHSTRETISKSQVDMVAGEVLSSCQDHLDTLWYDCSVAEQGDLVDLAQKGELSLSEIPFDRSTSLKLRGYAVSSGSKLKPSCRLMEKHAIQRGESLSDLRRVFGDSRRYERNIQAFLELRLAQLKSVDLELKGYVEKAVRDLLPEPKHAMVWMRSIAERALDLIWEKELPTREIPKEWTEGWKYSGKNNPPGGTVPSNRGIQCYLLRLMVDPREAGTTKVSRPTCLLLDYLQSVGDFGQHRKEGEDMPLYFAAAICLSAIELCEQLARDFGA